MKKLLLIIAIAFVGYLVYTGAIKIDKTKTKRTTAKIFKKTTEIVKIGIVKAGPEIEKLSKKLNEIE